MLPALNIRAAATPQTVNRFLTFIVFSSCGWLVDLALSRDNTRVLSIGCESIKQGTCQHEKPAFSAKMEPALRN